MAKKSKEQRKIEKTVKWAEDQAAAAVKEPEAQAGDHQLTLGKQGHTFSVGAPGHVFSNKVGRPTDYIEKYDDMAKKAASLGATDLDLAELFGVAESTIYLWKNEHPRFSESINAGKALIDDMVEKSLLGRALGGSIKETKVFLSWGETVTEEVDKHIPPDVAAQIFWLKNRRPKVWRDKHEVDFTNPLTLNMSEADQKTL